nr:unnamed protein product [Hydra vulgaris]
MLRENCSICGTKKCQFTKGTSGGDLVESINKFTSNKKLPFQKFKGEMHIPEEKRILNIYHECDEDDSDDSDDPDDECYFKSTDYYILLDSTGTHKLTSNNDYKIRDLDLKSKILEVDLNLVEAELELKRLDRYKGTEDSINWAASNGHLKVIKYLHSKGYRGTENAINWAALNGHLKVLEYLHELRYRGTENAINWAAENGHLEVLKYLHSLGYRGTENAFNLAAEKGDLEMLKYLHSLGYKSSEKAFDFAAKNGHLEVLKYLHSIGYKGTNWAINYAAWCGHLEVLKYLHSIGYKGTKDAIDIAVNEVKEYETGHIWSSKVVLIALVIENQIWPYLVSRSGLKCTLNCLKLLKRLF